MTAEFVKQFALQWVAAWNAHNIPEIMEHYASELAFHSPIIKQMGFNEKGLITDKKDLQEYFSKALQKYPDLRFDLHEVCVGTNSLVLYYSSINNKKAAEVMEFDEDGKVCNVFAHYN